MPHPSTGTSLNWHFFQLPLANCRYTKRKIPKNTERINFSPQNSIIFTLSSFSSPGFLNLFNRNFLSNGIFWEKVMFGELFKSLNRLINFNINLFQWMEFLVWYLLEHTLFSTVAKRVLHIRENCPIISVFLWTKFYSISRKFQTLCSTFNSL